MRINSLCCKFYFKIFSQVRKYRGPQSRRITQGAKTSKSDGERGNSIQCTGRADVRETRKAWDKQAVWKQAKVGLKCAQESEVVFCGWFCSLYKLIKSLMHGKEKRQFCICLRETAKSKGVRKYNITKAIFDERSLFQNIGCCPIL